MPRAAFDQVGEVYHGPGHPMAGVLIFTAPCRLVPYNHIQTVDPLPLVYTSHVTWDGPPCSAGPFSIGFGDYTVLDSWADVWQFPSHPGVNWKVILAQEIVPPDGLPYRRAYLFPVP